MLLVHQAGSVKVGEVVRYTLTYTPANDRILPTPANLFVKIKNTSPIPLRAAWVHGPYAIHVSAYPETFNPYHKTEDPEHDGRPQFEPMLKAGGSWQAKLNVPEKIRETGADLGKKRQSMSSDSGDRDGTGSVTWIIEIASQILFSNSASVHFEVLVGRDERSLDLGFAAVAGHGHGGPAQTPTYSNEKERKRAREKGHSTTAGVFSKAIRLAVEDTDVLWDKPALPTRDDDEKPSRKSKDGRQDSQKYDSQDQKKRKKKKIHLVILTHGMHSNIGADMLFLKESIDATVAQARIDAKKRKESYKKQKNTEPKQSQGEDSAHAAQHDDADTKSEETGPAPLSGGQEEMQDTAYDSDDEEQTIVRGFTGNAVRTENGIQYLGKRLAKHILRFTYPDQPFLPIKKPLSRQLTEKFKGDEDKAKRDGVPAHAGSSIYHPSVSKAKEELPYTFTSISFIGHSLGGLVQTYAMAYIHKHSPTFFTHIKPVNFVCMASPMLGLSNENPMYVKFALDFGLVGKTGRDLGLSLLAPRNWNAMLPSFGNKDEDTKGEDPAKKPLLRILPTGPAHQVLRMFRNRTVYSNVVNDGIVPLRTSCLLFLDWRGLGKVEKARRENGLIGTVAEWGWAELTGQNQSSLPERVLSGHDESATDDDGDNEHVRKGEGDAVPQPDEDETSFDAKQLTTRPSWDEDNPAANGGRKQSQQQEPGMWDNIVNFFKSNTSDTSKQTRSKRTTKAFGRGQTIRQEENDVPESSEEEIPGTTSNPTMRPQARNRHSQQGQRKRPIATRGDSLTNDETGELQAPPKTSIFESAGDILHPPLPSKQWINDPSSRHRTIFHDRVYHPEDIPPPPARRPPSRLKRTFSSDSAAKTSPSSPSTINSQDSIDSSGMKVEEKIARAYHRDLSWRKVLVRLEPDAHNNMIVRRMFANAYGWPVIKHLCDTHFGDTHAAKTRDEYEPARERAKPMNAPVPVTGEEVSEQTDRFVPERTKSETREAQDELAGLNVSREGAASSYSSTAPRLSRQSSGVWDDSYFEGSDGDSDDQDERNFVQKLINPMSNVKKPEQTYQRPESSGNASVASMPRSPTMSYTDGHRGLAPSSPTSMRSPPGSAWATGRGSVSGGKLVEEPEALGSTTELGLRKNAAETLGSPQKTKRPSGEGVRTRSEGPD